MAYYDITAFSYFASLNLFLCLLFSTSHHYYKTDMAFSRTLIYEAWNAHKSVSRNVDDRTFFFLKCYQLRLTKHPIQTHTSLRFTANCSGDSMFDMRTLPGLLNSYVPRDSAQVKLCACRIWVTNDQHTRLKFKPKLQHTGTTPQSTFVSLRFHNNKEKVGSRFKNVII
jgi:hypothetical protein